MYITDIVYLLDVLVVIVYMSYCNCWDYLLLHEDWGECSEDWAGACRWGGRGRKNVPGVLKRMQTKKKFGGGGFWGVWGAPPGGCAGSENHKAFPAGSRECLIRKQSDKNFLSLNPKYETIIFFHIWGVLGGPYVKPR